MEIDGIRACMDLKMFSDIEIGSFITGGNAMKIKISKFLSKHLDCGFAFFPYLLVQLAVLFSFIGGLILITMTILDIFKVKVKFIPTKIYNLIYKITVLVMACLSLVIFVFGLLFFMTSTESMEGIDVFFSTNIGWYIAIIFSATPFVTNLILKDEVLVEEVSETEETVTEETNKKEIVETETETELEEVATTENND